jgi:hypothetical protein
MCQLDVMLLLCRYNHLEFILFLDIVYMDDGRLCATASGGRVKMTRCSEANYRYKLL